MTHPLRKYFTVIWIAAGMAMGMAQGQEPAISLESLLKDMVDRDAIARWPEPPYVSRQASSYDRRSKTPDDAAGWFANTDNMDGLGKALRWETIQGRRECVMMEADGPGCVVRFWVGGAPPKGKVRFYLDGAESPAIEAPLYDLLAGKAFVPKPLAIENSGAAINLYLPVLYARHCKITYDEQNPKNPNGPPPSRWFNIEYRVYPEGAKVKPFTMAEFDALKPTVEKTAQALSAAPPPAEGKTVSLDEMIEPGKEAAVDLPQGPAAVRALELRLSVDDAAQLENTLRSTVLRIAFDGAETVWCPAGDFFGSGAGLNEVKSWYRAVGKDGTMTCRWVAPYKKSGRVALLNLGKQKVAAKLTAVAGDWKWDARSMYFHASWRQQRDIPTRPYQDWNYITIAGKGVYLGDTLALFNPTQKWWGEGDEKIFVDGEPFPSHFGTGSEDYYGYAWGNPAIFQGPFCNQPRADGPRNMGNTVNTRTRALDAIPFTKSLKFDMEIWHWEDCKVNYAVATYWYGLPGASGARAPQPDEAATTIPARPAPGAAASAPSDSARRAKIAGALECESMTIASKAQGLPVEIQDVSAMKQGGWSEGKQLFIRARRAGDFIELKFPVAQSGPKRVSLYGTKSWDYGILRFSINGKAAEKDYDAYSATSMASGPIDLGVFEPKDGQMILRVEVAGANPEAKGSKSYFGLDCVVLGKP
ncbi:MAG: DUF2961 domain-containing protein [Candidatus Sumerlaeota bacterium]|nr:DUF2961 domain-containing protein [Candidatus Sumerlaeota bacterium]